MIRILFCLLLYILTACSFNTKIKTIAPPELSERDKKTMKIISTLPRSPADYQWIIYKGLAFLKPVSWREYSNEMVYIATPTSFKKDAYYAMGISVRTIPNIKAQNGINADEAALKLINIIDRKKTTKRLLFSKNFTQKIKILRYRYLDSSEPSNPFIVHINFLKWVSSLLN